MVDGPAGPAAAGGNDHAGGGTGAGPGSGERPDDVAQVHRALGRYPPGRPDRVLYSVVGLVLLVPGVLGVTAGHVRALSAVVLGVLALLLGWAVPATIVDRAGFRRGRLLRRVPWSAVTTVHPPPRGGDVQVRLHDERVLRLEGVKADRLTGIVLLAHAAARPAPGPAPAPAPAPGSGQA